jgi:hypothetical protein
MRSVRANVEPVGTKLRSVPAHRSPLVAAEGRAAHFRTQRREQGVGQIPAESRRVNAKAVMRGAARADAERFRKKAGQAGNLPRCGGGLSSTRTLYWAILTVGFFQRTNTASTLKILGLVPGTINISEEITIVRSPRKQVPHLPAPLVGEERVRGQKDAAVISWAILAEPGRVWTLKTSLTSVWQRVRLTLASSG